MKFKKRFLLLARYRTYKFYGISIKFICHCSSRVERICLVCSCKAQTCLIFSTCPPFKLNAFDANGPRTRNFA